MYINGHEILDERLDEALARVVAENRHSGFRCGSLVNAISPLSEGRLDSKGWVIEFEAANRLLQRKKRAGVLEYKGRRWFPVESAA